jgi:DNA-binding CsgD family transcriptional regulator
MLEGSSALHGREPEERAISALLDGADSGTGGGGLVLVGGPGMGKSALLAWARRTVGPDAIVLTAGGIEAESGYPFAALHRLLAPIVGGAAGVPVLPAAQRAILDQALTTGAVPDADRFALCVATFTLLTGAGRAEGRKRPVLCCLDDVELFDAPSLEVLAFAARRVESEPVVMLLAATDGLPAEELVPGVPTLTLDPLPESMLLTLVEDLAVALVPGQGLPGDMATALVARCGGNPRALVELAATLTRDQWRGRAELPDELPRDSAVRRQYEQRIAALPAPARTMALLAAAAESADLGLLTRAAEEAGIDPGALDALERTGVLSIRSGRVEYRVPVVGGSIYRAAPATERAYAHGLLASASEGRGPNRRLRRAWHRLAAADRPDTHLGSELAMAADEIRAAGDHATASRAVERVAQLTEQPHVRADHLITAARDAWLSGQPHRAGVLLARMRPGPPSTEQRGHSDLLRAEIELGGGLPRTAHETFLAAARHLSGPHRRGAIIALVRAAEASFLAGDLRRFVEIMLRVGSLREADESPESALTSEYCVGMAALFQGRHSEAMVPLRRVLTLAAGVDEPTMLVWAALSALMLGEDVQAYSLSERACSSARARGELHVLPRALEMATCAQLWLGRFAAATRTAEDGLRTSREVGQANSAHFHRATLALLAVPRGDADSCLMHATTATLESSERGLGMPLAMATWALAYSDLAAGRTVEAATRLRVLARSGTGQGHDVVRIMSASHFVEAAVRCGDRSGVDSAMRIVSRWSDTARSPAHSALTARCRALVATDPGESAEHFRDALEQHRLAESGFERARTELLFGHALRRQREPKAARTHLRSALETFQRMDASPWIEQCRAELRATGETVAPGPGDRAGTLTPQQRQIAQIVAEGATNREVAAQLFLSPRTVDHHMRNIFVKLGLRSRTELARLLG